MHAFHTDQCRCDAFQCVREVLERLGVEQLAFAGVTHGVDDEELPGTPGHLASMAAAHYEGVRLAVCTLHVAHLEVTTSTGCFGVSITEKHIHAYVMPGAPRSRRDSFDGPLGAPQAS